MNDDYLGHAKQATAVTKRLDKPSWTRLAVYSAERSTSFAFSLLSLLPIVSHTGTEDSHAHRPTPRLAWPGLSRTTENSVLELEAVEKPGSQGPQDYSYLGTMLLHTTDES